MDRGEHVILHDAFADQDRVFVIVPVPRHEGDEAVAAQRQLAEIGRGTVGDDVTSFDRVAHLHQRTLVDAGILVRTLELLQRVDVHARLAGFDLADGADHDAGRVDLVDHAAARRGDRGARIARHGLFHAGADPGRFRLHERNGLALHVGAHQRAVGVIVFQERNERGTDRDELLGADVHQRDVFARRHQVVAALTRRDQLFHEAAILVEFGGRLRDGVLLLFHRGQVDHLVGDLVIRHHAIRRFDEAVFVDAREGRERVDQTDVRAFRRFDRADTAIVSRVNVADFEACALTRQTARPERGDAALMRHFRKRVGLVHELRKLAGAEELAHGSHGGLGVDEIVRHHRADIDRAHALLHGALHAQQADAVLVFQQLAHRTHAAIAEIVDVVDFALAVLKVHQLLHHREDVFLAQRGNGVLGIEVEAHVELHAADGRQVVAVAIEEQAFEQRFGGFLGRRLARTHDLVDRLQTFVAVFRLVSLKRVAHPRAGVDVVDVEQVDPVDARSVELFEVLGRDFLASFDVDAARALVDHVACGVAGKDFLGRQQQRLEAVLGRLVRGARADLVASLEDFFAGLGVDQREGGLVAAPCFGDERDLPTVLGALPGLLFVENVEDVFAIEAEREQQRGDRQLALAVDTHVDDVLGVEFEIEPRAAIRNDARREQQLARAVGLAAIVVEQDARRTVHLRDDDALGPVDDESAVARHQGHVAHIDVLLLDIEHGAGFGFLIHLEHDQAQGHLHRGGIGDAALAAFDDVVFRRLELVIDEVEFGGAGEVADRKDAAQGLFQAGDVIDLLVRAQELLVALALHLDQVRHVDDFVDVAEDLADAPLRGARCLGMGGLVLRGLRLGSHKGALAFF